MSLLGNLTDAIAYNLHQATYNPEAEQYAKDKAVAEQKAKDVATASANAKDAKAQADAKAKKDAEARAQAKTAEEERQTFSATRLAGRIFRIAGTVLLVIVLLMLGVYGASLSANLNLYREYPYRILYALYGFLLFFAVIPYVLIYRWYWQGKRPRFYSLIPIIDRRFIHPTAAALFGWLTFKPDDRIHALEEWALSNKK